MTVIEGALAIHHIAIQTSNLEKAVHFYRDVIGATLLERSGFKRRDMAWLEIGGTKIELFSVRHGERLEPWSDFQSGPVHIAFVVADLDSFLARAHKLGVLLHPSHPEPFVPPVPSAGRIAYLLGPDGEEVEIREADQKNRKNPLKK